MDQQQRHRTRRGADQTDDSAPAQSGDAEQEMPDPRPGDAEKDGHKPATGIGARHQQFRDCTDYEADSGRDQQPDHAARSGTCIISTPRPSKATFAARVSA